MPRIRTIKPEFWGDEKLGPMEPIDRLVFLGLISMADDAGRLLDSVKAIDGFVFAFTDDSSRESLARLSRNGRIERGTTRSGQAIIQIVGWHHQKVDHPNTKAALPPIQQRVTEDSRDIRESVASHSRGARDSISTNDLRPTTQRPSSPRAEAQPLYPFQPLVSKCPKLNAVIDPALDIPVFVELWNVMRAETETQKFRWLAEIETVLEGTGGTSGQPVPIGVVRLNLQDFLAQKHERPTPRFFRAFLRHDRLSEGQRALNGRAPPMSKAEEMFRNASHAFAAKPPDTG